MKEEEKEKKTQKRTEIAKARMLAAMEKSLGIVSNALRLAKVARSAYYRWLADDPEFAKAVKAIDDIGLDFGESQLMKLMKGAQVPEDKIYFHTTTEVSIDKNGKRTEKKTVHKTIVPSIKNYPPDGESVRFYLERKGRDRGYKRITEIDMPEEIGKIEVTRRVVSSKAELKEAKDERTKG